MGASMMTLSPTVRSFFVWITPTAGIYTLSLHDALPIFGVQVAAPTVELVEARQLGRQPRRHVDRKSTRLNSSHMSISYAGFCLKKKIAASEREDDAAHILHGRCIDNDELGSLFGKIVGD